MLSPVPLLTAETLARGVRELGAQISADWVEFGGGDPLHVVCTLNGAVVFFADLLRELSIPLTIDFWTLRSYGSGLESSGTVRTARDLLVDVRGRDVLVVEDIIDSGRTLLHIRSLLVQKGARSARVVSLLSKPSRRQVEAEPEYLGFEIEDRFVVGYGLDADQRFRNLPDLCVWEPD